jgi:hypothetical protein
MMPSSRKQQADSPDQTASASDTRKTTGSYLPADAPPREQGDFIDHTIAVWQKHTERKLTREDGREIIENVSGFFSILQEWHRRERAAQSAKAAASGHDNAPRRGRPPKFRD